MPAGITASLPSVAFFIFFYVKRKRSKRKHNFCEKFSFDTHCAQSSALETKRNRSQKLALRCVSNLLSSIIAQKCILPSAELGWSFVHHIKSASQEIAVGAICRLS